MQLHRKNRFVHGVAVLLALASVMAACGGDDDKQTSAPAEPAAGSWRMWVLTNPDEIIVPPPPAEGTPAAQADLDEVKRLAKERNPEVVAEINKWSGPLPTDPWMAQAFEFVAKSEKNPPLSSRNYALVSVAMYDAVVTAWHWKYRYNVDPPQGVDTAVPAGNDPSYPSEHAAMAGAASKVLAYLYPNQSALRLDEMADQAADSRVKAGTNTRADVNAGLQLGRSVAEKVIAYAKTDGADRPWDGRRPAGIGRGPTYWEPPPGSVSPPVAPIAATWKAWVMPNNTMFRPAPPPAVGSAEYRAAVQDMIDVKNNLTQEQKDIAKFWEGAEGTNLPAGIVNDVYAKDLREAATAENESARFTVPQLARAVALLNVGMADGGVSVWDAKYLYWYPRPENGVRDSGVDPNWTPFMPTPRFPAYPSGSAGYAGVAQTIMTYLFPNKAAEFQRRAEEQAISRVYGGIHWRFDAVSLDGGRQLGNLIVDRAKADGADS